MQISDLTVNYGIVDRIGVRFKIITGRLGYLLGFEFCNYLGAYLLDKKLDHKRFVAVDRCDTLQLLGKP